MISDAAMPAIPSTETDPWIDTAATRKAHRASAARQASTRRRYIDPTTCDRDYTVAEREFFLAIQAYKQSSGRMFPTWSEILEVLQGLGYEKVAQGSPMPTGFPKR
jgi:hypothetical protein